MPPRQPASLLTEAELELMLILWALGEASVREVLAALPANREVAYTTASTVLRILEKKGYVGSRKQGRAHIYFPLQSKDEYESRTLGHVVGKLFDRSPAALVARLIDNAHLSEEEIKDLRRLLDDKRG